MATSVAPPSATSAPPPAAPSSAPSAPSVDPIFDMIGQRLSESPAPSDSTPPPPPPEPPPAVSIPAPDEPKPPSAQPAEPPPAAPDAQPAAAQEPNPYENEDYGQEVPAALKESLLATPQGREVLASHSLLSELAKPGNQDGTGGIGHTPTIQQMKQYYGAYRDRILMERDLTSAKPEDAGRFFLDYVFHPNRGPAGEAIAKSLPGILAQRPELYGLVAEPFLERYKQALLDRGKGEKNPELKNALWMAAQIVHKDLNDEYLPQDYWEQGSYPSNASAQANPRLAAEREALNRERAEIERMRAENAQAFEQRWTGELNAMINRDVQAEYDQALKQLKTLYSGNPRGEAAFRKDIIQEMARGIQASDQWAIFSANLVQAKAQGTRQAMEPLVQEYKRMVQQWLMGNRKRILEEAGVGKASQSAARHTELQQTASHVGANGTGAAPAPKFGELPKQAPDELSSDYFLRVIQSAR